MSNQFEEPHDDRNDLIDSGVGFIVSAGFFFTVFIIFTIFDVFKG